MSFMKEWQRGELTSAAGELCHPEFRFDAATEWRDFPPDPCRYPNCSCRFGYQEEGADNCPERKK